jgi:GntR family transcriptional regulator/MocR family aminotransferase
MRIAEERALALAPRARGATRQQWLYDEIRNSIVDGRLAAGSRLPATRDLAEQHGVARGTVTAAYLQLAAEGYLTSTVGRGTFVSARIPDAMLQAATRKSAETPGAPRHGGQLSARGHSLAQTPFAMRPPAKIGAAFRTSQPDLAAFPFELWTRIASRRSRLTRRNLLADSDPRGYRPLREAIAAHLAAARGISCSRDHVVIFNSVQQALYLCAQMLLDPGDQVWIENPGYWAARQVLKAAEARVVPVPVDHDGMNVASAEKTAPGAKLAYTTPAHQAPLGMPLSLARRMRLLDWARASRAWIFEDDYDGEYRFTGRPLAALKSLDQHGCVVYAGTFSKLVFPALRLSYAVMPERLVDSMAAAVSLTARHAPVMPQAVLTDFIVEGHFGRHIRKMRALYGERAEALQTAARQYWSGVLDLPAIEAGLDVAGRFLRPCDDVEIVRRAARLGIETRALSACTIGRQPLTRWQGLILGFATVPPVAIRMAAQTLAGLFESM